MSKKFIGFLWKKKVNGEEIPVYPCPYFVGDFLITESEVSPNIRWKGTTWQLIEEETYLVSASESHPVKTIFGENEVTLTIEQIPNHNHSLHLGSGSSGAYGGQLKAGNTGIDNYAITSTGGGQAHNNMPKSYSVYIWKRVA